MAHFVKLDAGILDSSLWPQVDPRTVFLTALLMARPIELSEPVEALQVRNLDRLGVAIPAGWYGLVEASGIGIATRSGLSVEAGLAALDILSSPDPDSRTPDFEGRRMVRIPGGWLVLNFMRYRERDYRAAERMRRYRTRNRLLRDAEPDALRVTARHVTQAEAEAEAEKKTPRSRAAARPADVADAVWQDFAALRRQRRATVTSTVLDGIRREATAAGMSLEAALRTCVERGWQSFKADWATAPAARGPSLAKQAAHVPNMPLGHASCSCAGCTAYRAKRP